MVDHRFFSKALDTLPKALEEGLLVFGYLIAYKTADFRCVGLFPKALEEGLL